MTGSIRLVIPDLPRAMHAARELAAEIGLNKPYSVTVQCAPTGAASPLRVSFGAPTAALGTPQDVPLQPEGYALDIASGGVAVAARDEQGIVWGLRTLGQLLRANDRGGRLPCLRIRDYPSLRWRATQDDITRGPSPRLATLRREVQLCAGLKLNAFTYYLEHQYAFSKHPEIGPADGSLLPDELRDLVAWSERNGVELIGNQQSFGHFYHILKHEAYRGLRETADVLNPTNPRTYELLDDLYSEQAPLLTSKLFNVCCDETYGLGSGPSRSVAERDGVGGVYVAHIQRVHRLLRDRYAKRMMMWGDIILQHPDRLNDIPRDTVMLSWGYDARDSFDAALEPFARAGFEFWVCPGVSNWGRMLPDFATAVANIRNYVRDGVKHGATGMLNTVWNDDGETLFAPNWHGIAWGAECAWTGSATSYEDFNRRIGGVLFGERSDHFGQAIELLSRVERLPGIAGLPSARFWQADIGEAAADRSSARRSATEIVRLTDQAIRHLRIVRQEAVVNGDLLEHFLFGAERVRMIGSRILRAIDAQDAYRRRGAGVMRAAAIVRSVARDHATMKARYAALWNSEKRPYGLDAVLSRYDAVARTYENLAERIEAAASHTEKTLPSAEEIGLAVRSAVAGRLTRPEVVGEHLSLSADWHVPRAPRRVGVRLVLPQAVDMDFPIEVALPRSARLSGPISAFELVGEEGAHVPVPAQITRRGEGLALILAASPARDRTLCVYDGAAVAVPAARRMSLERHRGGGFRIGNGVARLTVGTEGAHVYRWELNELGGRDITQPGEADWAGFCDINGVHRSARNRLAVLEKGLALVRLRCSDPSGLVREMDFWVGAPWIECRLNRPTPYFACFDDIALMGAESKHPGQFVFMDGTSGAVKPLSASTDCQARRDGQNWCAKFAHGGALIGLITPDQRTTHVVGPGSGMGGVVIEGGQPADRFMVLGTTCPPDPIATMRRLAAAASCVPSARWYAMEERPSSARRR